MTRLVRLCLIAAAMTVFLGVMLGSHLQRRAGGTEILLDVEGYDPRDILLGHYALIRTPLQRLDVNALAGDDVFARGDRIYVSLETGPDGLAGPVAVHRQHPGAGIVAQGRVTGTSETSSTWVQEADPETGDMRSVRREVDEDWVHAQFNIERYYASRDRALALQERLRMTDIAGSTGVRLILSVPGDGKLIVKGFEIDGERRLDRIW
jgi:uncharacterized membrane-anchored protein